MKAGGVPGVTATARGSGLGYYGDSLRVIIQNNTGQTIKVRVPIGTRFDPGDTAVQTMYSAGDEVIEVPPSTTQPTTARNIKAFCGEMHDTGPSSRVTLTT